MAEAGGAFFSLKFMNIKNLGIMHNFLILSKECEKSVKKVRKIIDSDGVKLYNYDIKISIRRAHA